jgi:hypothetical protein
MTTRQRIRSLALAAVGLAAYDRLVHARLMSWGATADELRASYPGDDLIPGARRHSTMAATIAAPAEGLWPWLAQMGADRAGFYSWDRLDNGGRASAERIHPEWQQLARGDRMISVADGSRWFEVALLVPERSLVPRAPMTLPAARMFDPAKVTPRAYSDSTWAFHLTPSGAASTRLVVTGIAAGRPAWLLGFANRLFWDPVHWLMQTRQFAGLARRAEAR